MRRIAAATVVVRTKLRKHPVFSEALWERTHGAALVAIGYLLSETCGPFVISSSWHASYAPP